jgi:hypothetical protein
VDLFVVEKTVTHVVSSRQIPRFSRWIIKWFLGVVGIVCIKYEGFIVIICNCAMI